MGCILKPCADKVIPFSILGMDRGYGGTIHADSWFAAFRAGFVFAAQGSSQYQCAFPAFA